MSEPDALARLVAAARAVANLGSIDQDEYRTTKDFGLDIVDPLSSTPDLPIIRASDTA